MSESNPAYNIEVSVVSQFLESESAPSQNRYVFAYTVTIKNIGEIAAQLLTRHWIITDAAGKTQEVRGAAARPPRHHL